ncbi:MAG: LytR family transcriptional regulator, partial [Actinomycetota bacterium]|nr:LytR family transcriptional regulator [Actinomycetota bacterium]
MGSRGVPGRTRRSRDGDQPGAEPVTVEQLVARQGSRTGRRRAARRVEEPAWVRPDEIPEVRSGLPPVPGASGARPAPHAGLPPVPGAGRVSPQLGLRPVPVLGRDTALWEPESPPSRRSGPIPPLPGLFPPPGTDAVPPRAIRARPPQRPPASPGRRRLVRA